jgi:hypothetical protein
MVRSAPNVSAADRIDGFHATGSNASLFVFNHDGATAYLVVYVDDIILTASAPDLLSRVVNKLSNEFSIKDLGDLRFFLGVQVSRHTSGFFLNQAQYAEDVLERARDDELQAGVHSGGHEIQALHQRWHGALKGRLLLPEHRRRVAVLNSDSPRCRVRRQPSLFVHACPA